MLTQDKKQLLIGQVTELSGISIRTIRYYESVGLIKPSGRTEGGFRQFSADVLTRLAFIKRAQHLGLSLEEIRDILEVYDHGQPPCVEIQDKLQEKLLQIDHQIEQLLTLRSEITGLLSGWQSMESQPQETICPIIQNNYRNPI
ncbi:heavy metal-responsive transcriptional regulator [Anabaena cylindrica FACHB-243]|uniref:Transcriptional regulator, MerR family n=1 Tax=Anabaena cylindrica (strain ATCC 27899 / PCC 7122) TaxID=272123 RepID=K9ZIB1_ANACC|nr:MULTISPECIES: heavy metal-responsive transcriptional regulator [Anabaena]AFZ58504.1 transcriptional regulator, MerR family [Anabaena cylindrica PCC 7122]MBD2417275.1 heavy metal-responsive transcriptional regulator [Anabaena cylindrica FACHB-243]MBY5281396.1 heavy metal-responsive transcriptional regulator [Anabaena sp. CCAP 1446/1C]MBY5310213.1 heavy metal-responsive transcriptional regulator [Anabaena sp. CCAP 1446/1C]MCM2410034.1 heavy metal-responsive transcriptional regulator [Anabaena